MGDIIIPKKRIIHFSSILILFSMAIIIIACAFNSIYETYNKNNSIYKEYITTKGIITYIDNTSASDKITVEYSVNGNTYSKGFNYYIFTLRVGDSINIRYNENFPEMVVLNTNGVYIGNIVFSCIGFIMFLICVFIGLKNYLCVKILNNLSSKAKSKRLTIISTYSYAYSKGRYRLLHLVCLDEQTNIRYVTNRGYYMAIDKFIIGSKIDMYIDYSDKELFYIDTTAYLKNNSL